MPKYKVARCDGWPILNPGFGTPTHALGDVFDSDSAEDAAGARSGYLEIVSSGDQRRKSDAKPEAVITKDEPEAPR